MLYFKGRALREGARARKGIRMLKQRQFHAREGTEPQFYRLHLQRPVADRNLLDLCNQSFADREFMHRPPQKQVTRREAPRLNAPHFRSFSGWRTPRAP